MVNNLRICISAIFAEAVERELIKVNHSFFYRKQESYPHIQPSLIYCFLFLSDIL